VDSSHSRAFHKLFGKNLLDLNLLTLFRGAAETFSSSLCVHSALSLPSPRWAYSPACRACSLLASLFACTVRSMCTNSPKSMSPEPSCRRQHAALLSALAAHAERGGAPSSHGSRVARLKGRRRQGVGREATVGGVVGGMVGGGGVGGGLVDVVHQLLQLRVGEMDLCETRQLSTAQAVKAPTDSGAGSCTRCRQHRLPRAAPCTGK